MRTLLLASFLALPQAPASAGHEDLAMPSVSAAPARIETEVLQQIVLAAGTEIRLEMLQTVTTEGRSWEEGDEFMLAVADDVSIGAYMIIPKGTLAFGHVRWRTARGAFGKSGKIEVEIDRLVLGGKDILISGVHREDGKGGLTNAATVIAAGPLAGFITGESGAIERGTILSAYLVDDLPVAPPFKSTSGESGGQGQLVVRARQISVAEAFGSRPNEDAPKPMPGPERVTVAEAFESEMAGLGRDQ